MYDNIKVLSAFPRTSILPNPENGKLVEVVNDIAITVRNCNIYYGDVKYKKIDGVRIFDASNLEDLTPDHTDLPSGIECRIMACDINNPILPVEFKHGEYYYRGVWIKSEDLKYQSGHQGHHLNGGL